MGTDFVCCPGTSLVEFSTCHIPQDWLTSRYYQSIVTLNQKKGHRVQSHKTPLAWKYATANGVYMKTVFLAYREGTLIQGRYKEAKTSLACTMEQREEGCFLYIWLRIIYITFSFLLYECQLDKFKGKRKEEYAFHMQTCSISNKFPRLSPLDMEISSNAFIAAGCSSVFSVTWCSCKTITNTYTIFIWCGNMSELSSRSLLH